MLALILAKTASPDAMWVALHTPRCLNPARTRLFFSVLLIFLTPQLRADVWFPTFPGAEGFGARTVGGRGGVICEVTNLNDSGPGSLRAAIEASGPRIVVFRTGGTIELQSTLLITHPYITIAGQTAPGGGIALKNAPGFNRYEDPSGTLDIRTHDVVLQHLRVRPGQPVAPGTTGNEGDCLQIYGPVYNLMIDHCSFSWAVDENVSSWLDSHDWTAQWCITSEALRNAGHSEGTHSMGLLIGSEGAGRISLHHNLLAHNKDRNPRIKTTGVVDFVNNVIYDYGEFAGLLSSDYVNMPPFNYVGNFVRSGPASGGAYELAMWEMGGNVCTAYVDGNLGPHRSDETLPNINVVDPADRSYVAATRFDALPVITDTATQAYTRVLLGAGALRPARDAADQRIVSEVIAQSGQLIDSPTQVGGWPALDPGTPPADTDHDGMPDAWETLYALNPASPADGPLDADGDGYTNVEEFLSGTDPRQDPLCGVKLVACGGASPDGATLTRALPGRPLRTDRADTITALPAGYGCAVLVRTAAADRTDTTPSFLTLSLASSATVAVAYDARATTIPAWLSTWTPAGQTVSIRERGTTEQTVVFNLRTRAFTGAQTVTLPGNHAEGGDAPAGYIVLVLPDCPLPAPLFDQHPASQLVYKGRSVVLSASARGEGPIRYQWKRGTTELADSPKYAGTLTPTLTITQFGWNEAGSYQLVASDFWCAASSATAVLTVATPCDYDDDQDVDQEDFAHFQRCLGAPPADTGCQDAQLDGDPDVDGDDFALFVQCMSGPAHLPPVSCRNP